MQNNIEKIKGFLDEDEGNKLYELARFASKLGPCLEIGSYCGKSTVFLGKGCKENSSILYSIDHHMGSEEQQPGEEYFDPDLFNYKTFKVDTFYEFRKTINNYNLDDTIVPIICFSKLAAKFWSIPLSLVFIDGGHAYETVFNDYNFWFKHIIRNGYLLFHDIYKDPTQGGQAPYQVYQLAIASGLFIEIPMIKSLGILKKK